MPALETIIPDDARTGFLAESIDSLEDLDLEGLASILVGDHELCPHCGERSAYAFEETSQFELHGYDSLSPLWRPEPGSVGHIGSASGFEWTCGHCDRHVVWSDSPIADECYTH